MIQNDRVSAYLVIVSLSISVVVILAPLPAVLAAARPALYAATVLFWVLMQPARFGVVSAWLAGLPIDALFGTPLAQHALAMAIAAYLVVRLRAVFWTLSPLQQALLMAPVFVCYEFVLFWIDGMTGASVAASWRWLPVLTTTLVWPFWSAALERVALIELR